MRHVRPVLLAVVIVLCGSRANGAEIFTPIIETTGNNDDFNCYVLNTSGKTIEYFVASIDIDGNVISISNSFAHPGTGRSHSTNVASGGTKGFCRVSGKFPKKKVLVSFCVEPSGQSGCGNGIVTSP